MTAATRSRRYCGTVLGVMLAQACFTVLTRLLPTTRIPVIAAKGAATLAAVLSVKIHLSRLQS